MIGVPYKGTGPAVTELIGGQVDVMIADLAIVMPHVQSRRLKAIAVTGAKRSVLAPAIPTMAEAGVPGYALVNWRGVLAPANTPRDIVMRLNGEFVKVLALPELRDALAREATSRSGTRRSSSRR